MDVVWHGVFLTNAWLFLTNDYMKAEWRFLSHIVFGVTSLRVGVVVPCRSDISASCEVMYHVLLQNNGSSTVHVRARRMPGSPAREARQDVRDGVAERAAGYLVHLCVPHWLLVLQTLGLAGRGDAVAVLLARGHSGRVRMLQIPGSQPDALLQRGMLGAEA